MSRQDAQLVCAPTSECFTGPVLTDEDPQALQSEVQPDSTRTESSHQQEIGQAELAVAQMGCQPQWDPSSSEVSASQVPESSQQAAPGEEVQKVDQCDHPKPEDPGGETPKGGTASHLLPNGEGTAQSSDQVQDHPGPSLDHLDHGEEVRQDNQLPAKSSTYQLPVCTVPELDPEDKRESSVLIQDLCQSMVSALTHYQRSFELTEMQQPGEGTQTAAPEVHQKDAEMQCQEEPALCDQAPLEENTSSDMHCDPVNAEAALLPGRIRLLESSLPKFRCPVHPQQEMRGTIVPIQKWAATQNRVPGCKPRLCQAPSSAVQKKLQFRFRRIPSPPRPHRTRITSWPPKTR